MEVTGQLTSANHGYRSLPPLRLWRWDLRGRNAELDLSLHHLSPREHRRLAGIVNQAERRRFLFGRYALRKALSECTGLGPLEIRFRANRYGALRMQGAARHQWRFSLSHSGDLVYVAIARALRVGVDVEQVRPALDWEAAGELCLEPVERQQLMRIPASDRCAAFHRIWCRKEALAKAAGKSMHVPLGRPAGGWNLTELQAPPGYMAALAVECPL